LQAPLADPERFETDTAARAAAAKFDVAFVEMRNQ
jgi:hypothetical protein